MTQLIMSSIHSAPLKGIPFPHSAKTKPVHLKADQFQAAQLQDGPSSQVHGLDLGVSQESEEVNKGFLSSLFGGKDEAAAPALAEPVQFRLGQTSLPGHYADDIKHSSYPSSRTAIRTYMPVDGGKVASIDFQSLLATAKVPAVPSQRYVVTQQQVEGAVSSTGEARQTQLDDLSKLSDGDRVVPKDATLNPTDVAMYLRSTGDVSTTYAQQLSQIGQLEGFHVVAGIAPHQQREFESKLQGYDNISLMQVPHGEVWVEDYSEPTLAKGQVVPAIFQDSGGSLVHDAITEGRKQRYEGTGLDGTYAYHGAVNQGKFQETALARGTLTQGGLRQALSYMEGGNIYTGTRANGEGYVLVGKDSFHVTHRLLEKQTGREWSEAEVSKVIAADLGLKPEGVVPVEQPAAFHLDMRMTAVAPGEIALNDSKAAAEQQIAWMRGAVEQQQKDGVIDQREADKQLARIEKQAGAMRRQAEKVAPYEDMTARDLEQAGFTVHRLAGSFVDPSDPKRDTSNYFNARHGTNEQGERFTILMGGQAHEEAFVAQKLFDITQGEVSRIHFLDPSVTQKTLDLWGGLKCRTKPEGDLISQQQLEKPVYTELQTA